MTIGTPYALALTGDHAAQAHGLIEARPPARDLEVATEHAAPMEQITATVRVGLAERGWLVHAVETTPLSARLVVTDPTTAEVRTVDILKETLWHPPVETPLGPTLSLEDVVGTKVRAVADRGTARDLIAVHAATAHWTTAELEELARRHTSATSTTFDLTDLQSRLEGTEWLDDREFASHGLTAEAILELRQWAQTWADDIAERLLEEEALAPPTEDDPW
nr:nucleotidyl transferase AbiEii/AbiGii toxin family protein [Streptomyces adelaidensis]